MIQKMHLLQALKRFEFGRRRLNKGDKFEASAIDAGMLIATGLAERAKVVTVCRPREVVTHRAVVEPKHDLVTTQGPDIEVLRNEYFQKSGLEADKRWRETRLIYEIGQLETVSEKIHETGDETEDQ